MGDDEYGMVIAEFILPDERNRSQANKRMPNVQNVDANKVLIVCPSSLTSCKGLLGAVT